MSVVYVDTSCLVALALGERGARGVARRLRAADVRISSNLLEAELRAALAREQVAPPEGLLDAIGWILPDRSLTPELVRVLDAGYVRGADLWHLACALYVTTDPRQLTFLTLDQAQRSAAARLGFTAPG